MSAHIEFVKRLDVSTRDTVYKLEVHGKQFQIGSFEIDKHRAVLLAVVGECLERKREQAAVMSDDWSKVAAFDRTLMSYLSIRRINGAAARGMDCHYMSTRFVVRQEEDVKIGWHFGVVGDTV
jgi:hypothetical protein